jgi:acetyl-CoA C-acetyltransferase
MEMKEMSEVYVLSGVRTAIGDYGGALKDVAPTTLASQVLSEAVRRAGVASDAVGHVVFGNVIHTEPRDMYLARVAALDGGLAEHTPALTLNRLCGSGLQAVLTASDYAANGHADIVVAGGAESMSRALYGMPAARWGQRMGDTQLIDMMAGALTDPFGNGHMGITAENVARLHDVTREQQDGFALQSHARAARAVAEGRFESQILPQTIRKGRENVSFETDEHVRATLDIAELKKLRPAFLRENGTVTPGNASSINDGAAALVLASERGVREAGSKPLGRLVAYAHAAIDPKVMGLAPIPAVQRVLERARLKLADIDVIECNEAFASQACAVARELMLDPERLNPNGGAIALGHPIGATGAILTVKLLYELQRTGGRYGLVTLCIGGGQGIAAIFARE